jgi:hypothetical protein
MHLTSLDGLDGFCPSFTMSIVCSWTSASSHDVMSTQICRISIINLQVMWLIALYDLSASHVSKNLYQSGFRG